MRLPFLWLFLLFLINWPIKSNATPFVGSYVFGKTLDWNDAGTGIITTSDEDIKLTSRNGPLYADTGLEGNESASFSARASAGYGILRGYAYADMGNQFGALAFSQSRFRDEWTIYGGSVWDIENSTGTEISPGSPGLITFTYNIYGSKYGNGTQADLFFGNWDERIALSSGNQTIKHSIDFFWGEEFIVFASLVLQVGSNSYYGSTDCMANFWNTIELTGFSVYAKDDENLNWVEANGFNLSNTSGANYGSAPVPEPSTMLLLGFGLMGFARVARKKMMR